MSFKHPTNEALRFQTLLWFAAVVEGFYCFILSYFIFSVNPRRRILCFPDKLSIVTLKYC